MDEDADGAGMPSPKVQGSVGWDLAVGLGRRRP